MTSSTTWHRRAAALTVAAFVPLLAQPPGSSAPVGARPLPGDLPVALPDALPVALDGTGVWPLAGRPRVVTGFSPPSERWARGHRGVDLAGAAAQQVVAALAGEVTFAGMIAGRGVVVVRHGPTRTTYEPVLAAVEVGRRVEAGTRLGWLHPTGSHCAPRTCLHWGWRHGDVYLDPLDLVGGVGVRLLPLWTLPGPLPLPAQARAQARGWAWE